MPAFIMQMNSNQFKDIIYSSDKTTRSTDNYINICDSSINVPPSRKKSKTFRKCDDIINQLEKDRYFRLILRRDTLSNADYIRINSESARLQTRISYHYVSECPFKESQRENNNDKIVVINGISGVNCSKDTILTKCETMIFFAHGEGGHLKLNQFVLCGCSNSIDSQQACRKESAGHVIHTSELNVRNCIIFSCNSALFANELYPDSNNLLFSMLNQVDYAIAALSPIEVVYDYINFVIEALKSGMSFTEVTYYLNQLYFMHQGTYPFVCCTRKLPDELTNCNLSCSFHSIQAINGSVIAIVPSWIKGKCFRLPESLLVFSNKKLEYETRSVKSLKDGQRRICSFIHFFEDFSSYLILNQYLNDEMATLLQRIADLFRQRLQNINIMVIQANRFKIISKDEYYELLSLLTKMKEIVGKQIRLLSSNGYLFDQFEAFVRSNNIGYPVKIPTERCGSCCSKNRFL